MKRIGGLKQQVAAGVHKLTVDGRTPRQQIEECYELVRDLDARKRDLFLLRLFKGAEAADKLAVIMGVEPEWLQAGFDQIDADYGNFDGYVREGLGLSEQDVARLKSLLLEPAGQASL